MKAGILSDTHDHHGNVLAAVEIFNEQGVEIVLHAGDMVAPFTARAFAQLDKAAFIAVFGNNEGEKLMLSSTVRGFGGEIHEYCYKGQVGGKRVFMTHTPHDVEEVARSGMYDLVIYGHTHKPESRWVGKTRVINPGETTDWVTGRAQVVVLDTDTMAIETFPLR